MPKLNKLKTFKASYGTASSDKETPKLNKLKTHQLTWLIIHELVLFATKALAT